MNETMHHILGKAEKYRCLKVDAMKQILLYPLRFEPICQYRLWRGRRLAE